MAGFKNTLDSKINPGGFENTTSQLVVSSSTGLVDVGIALPLPSGTNFLGYVGLNAALPQGSNHIGFVTANDGQIVALQAGSSILLAGPIPTGSNEIGTVALKTGSTVALANGTSVGINGSVNVGGSVAVSSLPNVTVASLPPVSFAANQTVNIGSGVISIAGTPNVAITSMPQVVLAPNQTIAVTGATLSNVSLNAGTAVVGKFGIDGELPAGNEHIGQVSLDAPLPSGSNTLGKVDLNGGSNVIGGVYAQGMDRNSAKRTLAVDTGGALVPPVCTVIHTIVSLPANQSIQILAANPDRLLFRVQLMELNTVLISESGVALQSMNSPGYNLYSGGEVGREYTPPFSGDLAIYAMCGQTSSVRVTEYIQK